MLLFTTAQQQNNSSANSIISEMKPSAVAKLQFPIKIPILDLNQQQWILRHFADKAAHLLAVVHFPGGRGRCLLGKSDTREPDQRSERRNAYISSVFAAAPNTPHAELEALHARTNTTKQMQQKCLLQAAAASIVWPILKIFNWWRRGGTVRWIPPRHNNNKTFISVGKVPG